MKVKNRLLSFMLALITAAGMLGITPAASAEEINYARYELLDWQPAYSSYWNSTAQGEAAYTLQTGMNQFISSGIMFNRGDLPEGTIIEAAEGYQYRPEGWVSLEAQSARPENTSARQVIVDAAWWGNYNYRAFNVSKTDGSSFAEGDVDTVADAFRIYVPKQKGKISITAMDKASGTMDIRVENAKGIVAVASYNGNKSVGAVRFYTTDEIAAAPTVSYQTDAEYTNIYCWRSLETMEPAADKVSTIDLGKRVEIKMNKSTLKASTTLTASLNNLDAVDFEYQWLQSKDGTAFTEIMTNTEEEYYVSSQDKGRYLAVDVTPVYANNVKGETIRSTDVLYVENLGNITVDSPTAAKRYATRYTPDENRFTIEGSTRPYVLLDQYDDNASAFYILADYLTTPLEQHATDPQRINPQDEESIGYWLNNNFAQTGYEIAGVNKEPLEENIYKYVDKNHQWWVEAGIDGIDGDDTEDYFYTAGIGMMTQTETIKYIDRFGWCVSSEHGNWTVNWHTATGSEATDQYVVVDNFGVASIDTIFNAGEHHAVSMVPGEHKQYYARPAFYLGTDFFKNVRLNVASVGNNIKKMLINRYTQEELSAIYSEAELQELWTVEEAPEEPTEGLKVLAIGNSFSVDSMEYLYNIADTLTEENIVLGNMYIGGCTLNMHNTNAKTNAPEYLYYKNTDGEWKEKGGYTLRKGIMDEDWDMIVLQQASGSSGIADTYNSDLTELAAYVKAKATNPEMRLGWNMTWAYQQDSTHEEFPKYNNDQSTMYQAIVDTVQAKIAQNSDFDFIIPTGTAIQNARTSYIGDTLTRDGFHLSLGIGRYIAAMTWAKQITGVSSVDAVTWVPSATAVNGTYLEIAKESVKNAYTTPYAVTESLIKTEPMDVSIVSDTAEVGAGTTLTASLKDDSAQSFKYQWITSADGVNYEALYGQTASAYVVTNQDKNQYLGCQVTPVLADNTEKATVQSKTPIHIVKLGLISAESPSPEVRFATKDTPAANQFTIEGSTRKYVLLDKFNDRNSAFYVLSDFLTANINDPAFGLSNKDVSAQEDKNSVGYWLNHDYVTTGYEITGIKKEPLEEKIYQYVDKNHTWWLEAGIKGVDSAKAEDYSYQAGIGLLTESESRKYRNVYGWHIGTEHGNWTNPWYLATGSKDTNKYIMTMNYGFTDTTNIGGSGEHPVMDFNTHTGEVYARPSFYLNQDFFAKVRLDVSTVGENVKKVIRDTYSADQLGIYSAGELRKLGYTVIDATIEADTTVIGAKTTLTASMGDDNAVGFNYQWMQSASENGAYTDMKTARTDKYYVTNQDKNMYLKCRITPVYADGKTGASATSNTVYVENLGMVTGDGASLEVLRATANTPDAYKFTVAGSTRVYDLLDEFNSQDSAYFVLADYLTNYVEYDSVDPSGMNPSSATNIAYWLNNNYVNTGYELAGVAWPKLEEEIYRHVDKNHTWWVEAGVSENGDENTYADYAYTAGIGLLTESESVKYREKYGWNATTENGKWYQPWYLATGNNATDKYLTVLNWEIAPEGGLSGAGWHELKSVTPGTHGELYARPAFYLDFDFFKTVKLDLSKTGSAVKDMLKANYTEEELKNVYDYADLAELGFEIPVSLRESAAYKNGEIYVDLNYTNTTSNPVMVEVRYASGEVSDSYTYDDILWEGDTASAEILVKTLPLGENVVTIELVIDDVVVGTLVKTITVVE